MDGDQNRGLTPLSHGASTDVKSDQTRLDQSSLEQYDMGFSVQPPREARCGVVLSPPLVAKIRRRTSAMDQEAGDETAEHSGLLWASASLLDETGVVMLAPPRMDLFRGSLVDSARPSSGLEDETDSFVKFSNLSIRESGSYRIQITLSKMEKGGSTSLSPLIGTVTVAKALSELIRVT